MLTSNRWTPAILATTIAIGLVASDAEAAAPQADAFHSARDEFVAQWNSVGAAGRRFHASTSAAEQQDALLLMENALTESIVVMDALEHECFRGWATVARAALERYGDFVATYRATGAWNPGIGYVVVELYEIATTPAFVELHECADLDP